MKWGVRKNPVSFRRVRPEKDWRRLVIFALVSIVLSIIIGVILWLWLMKVPETEAAISRTPSSSVKSDDIAGIVEYMKQRATRFAELQRTPLRLVDPSVGR